MSLIVESSVIGYLGTSLTECISDFDGNDVLTCNYVKDLTIGFSVGYIDGASDVLGRAGPDYSVGGFAISGFMEFDSADLEWMSQQGNLLNEVVLHEMGHVIGIGTLWSKFVTPSNCNAAFDAGYAGVVSFNGSKAVSSLPLINAPNSLNYVPVENNYTAGTRCAHWKEDTFKNELMTGYVSNKGNPLSWTTAFALEDLGYVIDESSPLINRTYNMQTAVNDVKPGAVGEVIVPLKGCLDKYNGTKEIGGELGFVGRVRRAR